MLQPCNIRPLGHVTDVTEIPTYWFALLDQARRHNDFAAAARAQRELEQLGVHVCFVTQHIAAVARPTSPYRKGASDDPHRRGRCKKVEDRRAHRPGMDQERRIARSQRGPTARRGQTEMADYGRGAACIRALRTPTPPAPRTPRRKRQPAVIEFYR